MKTLKNISIKIINEECIITHIYRIPYKFYRKGKKEIIKGYFNKYDTYYRMFKKKSYYYVQLMFCLSCIQDIETIKDVIVFNKDNLKKLWTSQISSSVIKKK